MAKTIYNEELKKDILENLRIGLTIADTCDYLCIGHSTFFQWMDNIKDFADEVKKAQMDCKRRNIGIIQKKAIDTWQCAAWWLERKHKNEFGVHIDHSGNMNFTLMDFMRKIYEGNKNGDSTASEPENAAEDNT